MKNTTILNTTNSFNPFKGPEIERIMNITQSQAEIWIACELGDIDANRGYNESITLVLKGDLDKNAIQMAVQSLVERHEALRSVFSADGRFMSIFKQLSIAVDYRDISDFNASEKDKTISDYLSAEVNNVFDLVKGPLFKVGLIKVSESEHHLILTAHHIICDGWSFGIILEELGSFYSAHIQDIAHKLPRPETFSAYAEEEEKFIGTTEYNKIVQYWLDQYKTSTPTVKLPIDFPRPQIRTYGSNRLDFRINNDLVSDLKKVGIKSGASFVVTLLSAFEVFLFQQTGQDDLVLGLPASGQSQSGKTQLIGHCVNLLPLRSKLVTDIPFNTYLKNRKNAIFDAYDHQQFSFGQLLQKLPIARDLSRVPLVPVVFNVDMGMDNGVVFSGLSHKLKSNPRDFETFELSLNATGREDELILEWSYNRSLFKASTIAQMMASFKEILLSIVANPSNEIGNIIKVNNSASLELNLTDGFSPNSMFEGSNYINNEDFIDYAEGKNIVDLFLTQVKKTPNNIAVAFNDKKITYRELDTESNRLANYLVQSHNVLNGDLVGLMIERSEVLIISILGILKTGAAYVPIDTNYPEQRKNYIQKDSKCKVIINETLLEQFTKEIESYSSDKLQNRNIKPSDVMYVIYTSGTTGNPKGVMIEHKSVVNLIASQTQYFNIDDTEHILQFSNYCFDASIEQIFLALLNGAALFILDKQVLKNNKIPEFITEHKITHLHATPSYLETLPELSEIKSLKRIISGGEACNLKLAERLGKGCDFYNEYGPTETTVTSTIYKYKSEITNTPILSIGKPIGNTIAYILSENLELLPNGEVGELCLGGAGLAKGYLNQPELTAEKFVDNPFLPNEKIYHTGDYAKRNTDGNIEFIGRKDDQVKIRGYRIELMEVETVLNSLPNIKHAVVVTSNHLAGELSLVAYLQPTKTKGDSNTVRNELGQIMPEFQIPSTFMWVKEFPLTTNGKIDKKNLPSPEYIRPDSGTDLKIPLTKLEKDIANVWGEFLKIPVIDVEDNFFEMGGSSLLAQRVVVSLRKKLNTEIPLIKIFQYPTISQLAKFLNESFEVETDSDSESIRTVFNAKVTASINNLKPLELHNNVHKKKIKFVINTTKAQSEILTDCIFGGDDAKRGYNISLSLKLKGKLKYDALELAIQSLVERHESLRSSFSEDLQLMHIYTDYNVDILYHDISKQGEAEKQQSIKSLINKDLDYLFDLVNGPLLKFSLVKIDEFEHELMLLVNHAICDGLSTGILLEELGVFYTAFCQEKTPILKVADHFSLFADKENKFTESDAYKRSVEYWLNMYQESIPKLDLPIDFPRPTLRTYNSHHLDFLLDNEFLKGLKQLGNGAESRMVTSIVTTLVAAFEVFLSQQIGKNDLVLGLISSTRANYDMMQMVGHSVNLLPLRSKVDTTISFNDYLAKRNTQLFDAYENQSISFGSLLEKLAIPRDPSRVPLVPVIINIQLDDVLENENSFFDLSTEIKYHENNYRTFEIELQVFMSSKGPCFRWRYNTTLFKPESIQKMMASFEDVMTNVVANPNIKIADLIKVDDSAYVHLNATKTTYPQLPLHELIAMQVQISPLNQAVKFNNVEVSYENLEQQVNQLTHCLKEKGINQGDFVGVCLPRSKELVVTLLAIMKSGAAYLPLDPSYPNERLDFMINDSEAKFLITTNEFSTKLETSATKLLIEDLFLDLSKFSIDPFDLKVNQDEIAYLLYTSGSTGKPKGVQVSHKNLVNFLSSMALQPGIKETDRLLSITTISFDIAGLELFLPLLKGAELVIADDETAKDGRLMLDLIKEEKITMLQATPSTWQMLLDSGWETELPIKALCGGEALPLALAKKLLNKVDELWNVYGPTETTIWSAVKQIKKEDKLITIGHPIANTQLYILNDQDLLVEAGAIGELCIAGDGVSKGYWKRPDLTSEKFIANPFDSKVNKILYRTGDLGKLLQNGEVQCLGRIDHQVKIRGHRIELGEIEQALDNLEGIQSSVVMVNADRLISYIILNELNGASINQESEWKVQLAKQLPAHMLPQSFHIINEFPKTLNGKIDRKALLSNSTLSPDNISDYTAPRTITEQLVADVWETCLNIKNIDVFSNFFELGGHSLIAVRVMSLLEKETGERLPLAALMTHSTIEKLALYMNLDNNSATWNSLVPIQPNGEKTPLYLVHGADHNVMLFKLLSNNLDANQPVYGLQAKGLNGIDEPHKSVEEMAAHYISEIVKSNPSGPYTLGGYSFGGAIAFEMARQLMAQNKEVKKVILLDSYVYPFYYYSDASKKRTVRIKYSMRMLLFMIRKMFKSKSNFVQRIQFIKDSINHSYLKLKYGKEKQHEMIHSWSYKLDQMHSMAINNYQILPLDIRVDLLRVEDDDVFYAHDADMLGWKPVALGGINKHIIPGNHINMLSPPNDKKLGRILQRILDN